MIRVVKLGATDVNTMPLQERRENRAIASGDEAFEGYWERPDANEKSLSQRLVFHTGDTGYADEDGDIYVTGRVDDMSITAVKRVARRDRELPSLHPAVSEVAVVGLPTSAGADSCRIHQTSQRRRSEDLDQYCRTSGLANFKRPAPVRLRGRVPKSPLQASPPQARRSRVLCQNRAPTTGP